jgi:hypothetical protein
MSSDRFACIEYNISNSSWHFGPNGSLWTDVTHKILYGPKRSWGPYTTLWVTGRSISCHLVRSAMNYLIYYTQYMQICQTTFFCSSGNILQCHHVIYYNAFMLYITMPSGYILQCHQIIYYNVIWSMYENIERLRKKRQIGKIKT